MQAASGTARQTARISADSPGACRARPGNPSQPAAAKAAKLKAVPPCTSPRHAAQLGQQTGPPARRGARRDSLPLSPEAALGQQIAYPSHNPHFAPRRKAALHRNGDCAPHGPAAHRAERAGRLGPNAPHSTDNRPTAPAAAVLRAGQESANGPVSSRPRQNLPLPAAARQPRRP